MSTLSDAGKLLKGSESESRLNIKAIIGVVVGGGLLWLFVNVLAGNDGGIAARLAAERSMPTATSGPELPTQVVVAMAPQPEDHTPTPWPTPIIIEKEVVSVVTVEVPGQSVFVEVPGPTVEVTRIVEVTPVVLPTITPVPLAPGTVKICVSVEGATGIYIGNQGVVSGGCQIFTFGVGQTAIIVQVNK